jgi:hypothetical protein
VFDAAGLKAADVPAAVEKHAAALSVVAHHSDAVIQAKSALANRLVWAASEAVPAVLKTLAPQFQTAVQAYTAAVEALPEQISSEVLVASDPALLAAFQNGVAAAKTLRKIDAFLASTSDLPEHGAYQQQPQLRVLNPQSRAELSALMDAKARSDAENKLVPLFLTAVRNGIEFKMSTCVEAAEHRKYLDGLPVVRKHPKFLRFA